MPQEKIKLTQLTQGGGGGSKVAPDILRKILGAVRSGIFPPQLLFGKENGDDAAVFQIGEHQAIVATTDFLTPIVDDPFDFGRVAATNAISNIYAMGASPLFALALVGMPVNVLPLEAIARILEGGESVCRLASIPVSYTHLDVYKRQILGSPATYEGRPASVGTLLDISAQKEAEQRARELADFDPLSGLPNRRLLRDRCTQLLSLIHI